MTDCWSGWIGHDNSQSSEKNNKYRCIHTVVPPDDGSREGRNMYRLTKHTKKKLCIKLIFMHGQKT